VTKVISTLEAATRYTAEPSTSGVLRSVLVPGRVLRTGAATLTEISDDDAKFLADHPLFQFHAKGGFVSIT
jgi:hypothetical protein